MEQPPSHLVCQISHELMRDPVAAPDGYVYDRTNILQWIGQGEDGQRNNSPFDRSITISAADLRPAMTIRSALEEYIAQHHLEFEVAPLVTGRPALKLPARLASELELEVALHPVPGETRKAILELIPQRQTATTNIHLNLVLDVSGSMGAAVTARDESNTLIEYNLCVMDLVKFASQVAVKCLAPGDVISIVTFSDAAKIIVEPISVPDPKMGADTTVADVLGKIDAIYHGGSTNLWAGIETGLQLLASCAQPHLHNVCVALTDGEPNRHPEQGYETAHRRFKQMPNFSYVLHTLPFGFGRIDSALLQSLARTGEGIMVNIPDCGMVGTVFTNLIANAKVTSHRGLRLLDLDGVLDRAEPTGATFDYNASKQFLALGTLQAEQPRYLLLHLNQDVHDCTALRLQLAAECLPVAPGAGRTALERPPTGKAGLIAVKPRATCGLESEVLLRVLFRDAACAMLSRVVNLMATGETGAARYALENFLSLHDVLTEAPEMEVDLNEQVRQALVPAAYKRWGHTYVPSLAMAHSAQVRHNFKDPGVQAYGGPLFGTEAGRMSDIFDAMPVPKGTRQVGASLASGAVLNNCYGGCYSADSLVDLASVRAPGTTGDVAQRTGDVRNLAGAWQRRADAIRAGDVLANGAVVDYVVAVACAGGEHDFCQLSPGLRITPWHPVREPSTKRWAFPSELVVPKRHASEYMYSFVLTAGGEVPVDGHTTVGLAHELQEPVAAHPFFGSPALRDRVALLAARAGTARTLWLAPQAFVRDTATGLVKDFNEHAVRSQPSVS
ncbi:uncharacterized protein MONBRDRAFT_31857 [Monosiga brevicollis MX1]|uniref:U-box domain-containing protein n=1 Tax=Monosiga brevicollis TaxID=81824 RepID=A9UVU8_MONBE|nr:uncharacterized protein MONBRDRAFT_31857 [Monosiga brevicollis MX1]EDQ90652.1 predicted protein [Monosiga brevicollis MX1]|eukprot:XP_001744703.1 hypothetical protein [Monosiga brevicollis MX1]